MPADVLSLRKYRATKLLLALCLLYLGFGKSFAYIGYYPFFLGEAVMACFLIRPWWFAGRQSGDSLSRTLVIAMLAIGAVQGAYSWQTLSQSGMETARNLATIYYALYAFIAARIFTRDGVPAGVILDFISSLIPAMLVAAAVSFVVFSYAVDSLPTFPRTDVPLLSYKAGDQSILVGIAVFLISIGRLKRIWLLLAMPMVLVNIARNRGAMLALTGFILASALMRRSRLQFAVILGATVLVLLVIGDRGISIGDYRTVSFSQLSANSRSVLSENAGSDVDSSLADTAEWRLEWWTKIMEDARNQAFIPVGLGWGVNLADNYGFQTSSDPNSLTILRNPHNVLMGILARGGWVIAGCWIAFYVVFIVQMLRLVHATPAQDLRMCGLLVLLCMFAGLTNGLVDVHLESPQNAIPHWCFVGIGWYCMSLKTRARNGVRLTRGMEILRREPALV